MFCEKCGFQLEDGSKFCPSCGNKIEMMEDDKTVILTETNEEDDKTVILEDTVEEQDKNVVLEEETDTVNETVVETATEETKEETKEEVKEEVKETQNVLSVAETVENAVVTGTVIETHQIKYCHNCGIANAENDTFCYSCGSPLDGSDAKKRGGKFKLNKVAKGAIAVAGIAVIAIGAAALLGGMGRKNTLLYLCDNEIMGMKKGDNYVISEDAYKSENDAYGPYSTLSYTVQLSKDGKYVYYPQNYKNGSYDLYYKKLGSEKAEATKICSQITGYYLLENGKILYMESGDTQKLYLYDFKDKEKVASNVAWYKVSKDEKSIFWYSSASDGRMYVCDTALKKEKEKLDSDVSSVVYISDDFKKIVYVKDNELYNLSKLENKKKIDSDIESFITCENGEKTEIYYIKDEGEEIYSYMDIVIDDLAEQDAAITEPNIADYQHVEEKPSFWGMREETVTDDAYYDELDKYSQKAERDYTRESWENNGTYVYNKTIFCYVPGEEDSQEIVSGAIKNYMNYSNSSAFLYESINKDEIEKFAFSDLVEMERYLAEESLAEAYNDAMKLYMICGGKTVEINVDFEEYGRTVNFVGVAEAAKECYFTVKNSDTNEVALFKTSTSKMDGVAELVAEEFYAVEKIAENGIYYTTEVENNVGELYFNSKKVDSDVKVYSVTAMKNGEGILYLTDPDDYYNVGTLKMYDGKKSVEIEDDATGYCSNLEGNVAFLVDYNFEKYRGDLMVYKNGKVTSVDDDVTGIIYY